MSVNIKQKLAHFLSELRETNATLDFYCDFGKIKQSVRDIEINLNTLNYLLGKQDLRQAVEDIWNRDSRVFEVLQILIAIRPEHNKKVVNKQGQIVPINNYLTSVNGIMEYLEGTGLDKLFIDKTVKNLVDYVFGIEVGLDTHARKNRSGELMESYVEKIFTENSIVFDKQVSSNKFPPIDEVLAGDNKVFDFVIKTNRCTYLIEVNFYHGGGSKPNETARSYTEVAPKVNSVEGYEFVWITDGVGWIKAKAMFTAAYKVIPNIYNLTHIQEFISKIKEEE